MCLNIRQCRRALHMVKSTKKGAQGLSEAPLTFFSSLFIVFDKKIMTAVKKKQKTK